MYAGHANGCVDESHHERGTADAHMPRFIAQQKHGMSALDVPNGRDGGRSATGSLGVGGSVGLAGSCGRGHRRPPLVWRRAMFCSLCRNLLQFLCKVFDKC